MHQINKLSLGQNRSEIVTNEYGKEIPQKRCISLEERQKVIDNTRLMW